MAVTTGTRSDALPDIPAVKEFVPDYEATTWYGVGAPKKPPAEIVERLNKGTNTAIADPKLKARLADLGAEPLSMTCGEFAQFIATRPCRRFGGRSFFEAPLSLDVALTAQPVWGHVGASYRWRYVVAPRASPAAPTDSRSASASGDGVRPDLGWRRRSSTASTSR